MCAWALLKKHRVRDSARHSHLRVQSIKGAGKAEERKTGGLFCLEWVACAVSVADTELSLCALQDAALDNWKADATNAVHDSLSTLREEMADRARLHGTISDDRIAKMQKAAQRNAMSSAERQVWNFLGPQLMQANDRIAELEGAMEALRQKARDAERTVTSCVDSASEQTKLMHSQIMEMTDALEKKHILWQRQRQRNVEFENRISEMQRQAAEAAKAAERKQRNYQADIKELNKTIAALDPTRNGGVPLKKLVEVVEAQLGLPVQVDTPMIIRLSACHRTIGEPFVQPTFSQCLKRNSVYLSDVCICWCLCERTLRRCS